jgi:hypothetical protein
VTTEAPDHWRAINDFVGVSRLATRRDGETSTDGGPDRPHPYYGAPHNLLAKALDAGPDTRPASTTSLILVGLKIDGQYDLGILLDRQAGRLSPWRMRLMWRPDAFGRTPPSRPETGNVHQDSASSAKHDPTWIDYTNTGGDLPRLTVQRMRW